MENHNPILQTDDYMPQFVDLENNVDISGNQSQQTPPRSSIFLQSILSEVNHREIKKLEEELNILEGNYNVIKNKLDEHIKQFNNFNVIITIQVLILICAVSNIVAKVYSQ